jgi:hypothetical protein
MKRLIAALTVALCTTSVLACHGSLGRRRRPQPAPPPEAVVVVTPPALSDGAWIDSVTKSWSTVAARGFHDSTMRGARARRSQEPSTLTQSTGPAITATAYAEAAPMSAAISGAADDHAPLLVVIAIGAAALLISIEAGRVALRP